MPFHLRHSNQNPLLSFLTALINIGMIFAPSIGYIIQGNKFKSKGTSKGFSLYGCLIITLANILRIFFWFGKHFTKILLYQSFIVLLSQLYLIKKYIDHSEKDSSSDNFKQQEDNSSLSPLYLSNVFHDLSNPSLFWKWSSLLHYLIGISLMFIVCFFECFIFGFNNLKHMEFIGLLSTSIEVFLGLPQIITNYLGKNVETFSLVMLITWIFGDFFKTIYYFVNKCPYQFILSGSIQLFFDFILIGQYWFYGKEDFVALIEEEISKDALGGGSENDNENDGKNVSTGSNGLSTSSSQNQSFGNERNRNDEESNKLVSERGNNYGSLDDNLDIVDI